MCERPNPSPMTPTVCSRLAMQILRGDRSISAHMRGIEQVPWIYDPLCRLAERSGLGRWRRWLTSAAHGRTLDLGCGTGRNLPLLPVGTRAIGVDPSAHSIRRARRRAPAVPLVIARAEALPFRTGSFDTVL